MSSSRHDSAETATGQISTGQIPTGHIASVECDRDSPLTIRQMCEAFDVTARALRFYEAKELLFPARVGSRRLYSRRDRARLKLILRGKRFGFALEEIRQLLDLYDMGDQQETQLVRTFELAGRHLASMKAQRAELDEAIAELSAEMDWGAKELDRLRRDGTGRDSFTTDSAA